MTALDQAPPAGPGPGRSAGVLARPMALDGGAGLARLGRGSGLGLGAAVIWLSLLILLPLAAVVAHSFSGGWGGFYHNVTQTPALDALRLTVLSSLLVAAVNAVMGTLLAWVLVRDDFPGRRVVDLVIDIPFALPTIVAGLVLLSVYGTHSPVGIHLLGTDRAIVLALAFVTLPFVVRAVQPVLMSLDTEAELAAHCLGASRLTTFRRIVLPSLLPAIASGATLAFSRAVGEYGAVLLISGGLNRTRVASLYVFQQIENYDYRAATAVATVLLAISLLVIVGLDLLQRFVARRG